MLKFDRYKFDGWKGWVSPECAEAFGNIDEWLEGEGRAVILQTPCRTVAKHPFSVNGQDCFVYSKLMRAQNDGALKKHELFSLLKWAFGPSRAIVILETTARMLASGHRCPRPLFAARRKAAGGHHLNLIVTAEVKAPTIESIVTGASIDDAKTAVAAAGRDLALLHADRFVHGDYLPRNTCLEDGNVVFLDNDKTRLWPFMAPFSQRRRNLEQFAYNLMLLKGLEECNTELPTLFIDSYMDAAKRGDAVRQAATVMEKARARWENRKARSKPRN